MFFFQFFFWRATHSGNGIQFSSANSSGVNGCLYLEYFLWLVLFSFLSLFKFFSWNLIIFSCDIGLQWTHIIVKVRYMYYVGILEQFANMRRQIYLIVDNKWGYVLHCRFKYMFYICAYYLCGGTKQPSLCARVNAVGFKTYNRILAAISLWLYLDEVYTAFRVDL